MSELGRQITPKEWVERWKRVAPVLSALRDQEIREADTLTAMQSLSDAFDAALVMGQPPRPSSGLVEFYRILGLRRP